MSWGPGGNILTCESGSMAGKQEVHAAKSRGRVGQTCKGPLETLD
jgi:uncharacterized protein YdbL (DUF1318 family)